ncbi:MAG: flavodoxin family protein [Pseudodesulfovibrio sp.]|nr:flavodoxin family protein [Pseudodesulfovibrio sp.]
MKKAVIYAGSHRKGGNSDQAANLLARGVQEAGGQTDIIFIRDHAIMPCQACGFCDKSIDHQGSQRCILGEKDEAWTLFSPLFTARTVLIASPIYFYHLPSMFKTWIDRSQQFWTAKTTGEHWVADLPKRTAHTVLVAGRPTGKKLFEGAHITLRYFLHNFNIALADPLIFRGVDKHDDLSRQSDFEARIIELGHHAWTSSR